MTPMPPLKRPLAVLLCDAWRWRVGAVLVSDVWNGPRRLVAIDRRNNQVVIRMRKVGGPNAGHESDQRCSTLPGDVRLLKQC